MSDLFLDTGVRWKVSFVTRICADSGYDDATLERIFWIEVFPQAHTQHTFPLLGVARPRS
jgi:hypothetical protein